MTKLVGANEFTKMMKDFGNRATVQFYTNLRDMATITKMESNFMAPIDTQFMVNSSVINAIMNGYEIVYRAHYSLYVHENLEVYHPNGTAKFLEKAVRMLGSKQDIERKLGAGI